jgi:hypothetical protein
MSADDDVFVPPCVANTVCPDHVDTIKKLAALGEIAYRKTPGGRWLFSLRDLKRRASAAAAQQAAST